MTPADAEIYRKYADELVRFASGLVGPSGAEDVVANAVLRAVSSARWSRVDNRRAYLYRAVLNEASSQHRSTARRLNREIRAYQRDVSTGSTESLSEDSNVDFDVLIALRRLSERQRAVIHLTYWADLPVADIASLLDLPIRTVERELSRARTRLEALLL
ncbi:MAG: RNA polymerase sigma factor [Ilumatobacteraceae bacterium]